MRQYCSNCRSFQQLKVGQDGFVDCEKCGRCELPDHMHCLRCGFACPHVEAGGIFYCPNCGIPKDAGNGKVSYAFDEGCSECGLPGHLPKQGYMQPVEHSHPRRVLGLAPSCEEIVKEVAES